MCRMTKLHQISVSPQQQTCKVLSRLDELLRQMGIPSIIVR